MPKGQIAGEKQAGDGEKFVIGGCFRLARAVGGPSLGQNQQPENGQCQQNAKCGRGAWADLAEPNQNRSEADADGASKQGRDR